MLSGQQQFLLVRSINHQHLVLVGDEFLDGFVDLLQCYLAVELACQFHLVLDSHQRFVIQEVAHAGPHKSGVTSVVPLTQLPFVVVQFQGFGTLQLCLSETMLTSLFGNADSGNDATQYVFLLGTD